MTIYNKVMMKNKLLAVMMLFVVSTLFMLLRKGKEQVLGNDAPVVQTATPTQEAEPTAPLYDVGLPVFTMPRTSQVIAHTGYTVSYNRDTRIPNWVAWTLTPQRYAEVVSRYDKFLPDPEVDDPVTTDDYKGAGIDRGHMCPAADNKWSEQAMRESFYMTNVCPQHHNLNRGDWKELEEACREWAMDSGELHIVCGPILYRGDHRRIGTHQVVVPEAFYKVVLCLNPPKAVGFIYKNTSGNHPLDAYVNTVDEVERITGLDFFSGLPDSLEQVVEGRCDLDEWPRP